MSFCPRFGQSHYSVFYPEEMKKTEPSFTTGITDSTPYYGVESVANAFSRIKVIENPYLPKDTVLMVDGKGDVTGSIVNIGKKTIRHRIANWLIRLATWIKG